MEPPFEVQKRNLALELETQASNGYSAQVSTRGHSQVSLTLAKGEAVMALRTTGKVSRDRIEATFGDFGQISLRFEGAPKPLEGGPFSRGVPKPDCRGHKPSLEAGTFRGTIRFHGENDFTSIEARAAPGTVTRNYRRICETDPRAGRFHNLLENLSGRLRLTVLRSVGHVDGSTVSFQASVVNLGAIIGVKSAPTYSFLGSTSERREGVRIVRSFRANGETRSFTYSGKQAKQPNATVMPPKPFAGSAEYLKAQGEPASWTGPLTVRLPGRGSIELTGPDFEALLCRTNLKQLLKGACHPGDDQIVLPPQLAGTAWEVPLTDEWRQELR